MQHIHNTYKKYENQLRSITENQYIYLNQYINVCKHNIVTIFTWLRETNTTKKITQKKKKNKICNKLMSQNQSIGLLTCIKNKRS